MTESGVLLIVAAVVALCAAPVLYVLWRDRTRIWSLEQRLLRLEAASERFSGGGGSGEPYRRRTRVLRPGRSASAGPVERAGRSTPG